MKSNKGNRTYSTLLHIIPFYAHLDAIPLPLPYSVLIVGVFDSRLSKLMSPIPKVEEIEIFKISKQEVTTQPCWALTKD